MSRVVAIHPGAELYGSDRMFAESVQGFVEAGHEVLAVVAAEGPLIPLLEGAGARVTLATAPVLRKSVVNPRGFADLVTTAARETSPGLRLMRAAQPDLVYVSTVTVPSWLALAKAVRARVVCHVHEAESEAMRAVRVGLNAPLVLADVLLLNSDFAAGVVTEAIPSLARKITVVPNGVAGPPTPADPVRDELSGPVRLLYSGRLSPRKGPDVALAATQLLRAQGVDAHLDLLGSVFPGYEWFLDQLKTEAADLLDRGVVRLLGFVNDIWAVHSEADIDLVPSVLPEPFGNAAVEALLAKRPVAASRIGGLPEAVAGASSARLAEPGSAASLAESVIDLIEAWPTMRERTEQSCLWAQNTFSPRTYREQVVRLSFADCDGEYAATHGRQLTGGRR